MATTLQWHAAKVLSVLCDNPGGMKILQIAKRARMGKKDALLAVKYLISNDLAFHPSDTVQSQLIVVSNIRPCHLSRKYILEALTSPKGPHVVVGSMRGTDNDELPKELGKLNRSVVLLDRQGKFSTEATTIVKGPKRRTYSFQNIYRVDEGGVGDILQQRSSYSPFFAKDRLSAAFDDANLMPIRDAETVIDNGAWHFAARTHPLFSEALKTKPGQTGEAEQESVRSLVENYVASVKKGGLVLIFSKYANPDKMQKALKMLKAQKRIDYCVICRKNAMGEFITSASWPSRHLFVIRPV